MAQHGETRIYMLKAELKMDARSVGCFWLGLKSTIFSQTWAHQTASVQAKLRIYLGTLSFELRHSLNQVNGCGKVGAGPLSFFHWNQGWWRKIAELNRE